MKKQKIVAIPMMFMLSFLMIASCQNQSFENAEPESTIDSVSYAFGYRMGTQLPDIMDTLNVELVAAGMQQAFNEDSSLIDPAKMIGLIRNFQTNAQAQMLRERMAEAEENTQRTQEFLAENAEKEGVMTTESGLQYKVIEEGSGASPAPQDSVTVHYEGTLLSGEVFDSSYNRGQPITFPLNGVIEGWTEGLQLMQEGATYKFWIPGELAYGSRPPRGSIIGPNELLIFKVELIEVN